MTYLRYEDLHELIIEQHDAVAGREANTGSHHGWCRCGWYAIAYTIPEAVAQVAIIEQRHRQHLQNIDHGVVPAAGDLWDIHGATRAFDERDRQAHIVECLALRDELLDGLVTRVAS